jgi:hypothetical protein
MVFLTLNCIAQTGAMAAISFVIVPGRMLSMRRVSIGVPTTYISRSHGICTNN